MNNRHTLECLREIPITRIMVTIGLVVGFTCGLVGRCNNQQASKPQEENYNSLPWEAVTPEKAGCAAGEAEELYNSNTHR